MEVKVAATCLNWSQSLTSQTPCSSHTLIPTISSPSSKKRTRTGRPLVCRFGNRLDRTDLFGKTSTKFLRSPSLEIPKLRSQTLRRASSDSFDGFSDEEFAETIQELAQKFHLSEYENNLEFDSINKEGGSINEDIQISRPFPPSNFDSVEPPWLGIRPEPPDWPELDEVQSSIERKANSVDLPLSLRIIKRKKQWQEGFREAGESTYCSMKKAFSSMVFIIRELQSYVLQMREILFFEDLQEILVRVQKEMQASFVWIFQQIFSHTPTLMVYVMILLANFTVYSITNNTAMAMAMGVPPSTTATVLVTENQNQNHKFDSSTIKTFLVSSFDGKTNSIGENNGGGGGKARAAPSGTDGGDGLSSFNHHRIPSFGKPSVITEANSGLDSEEMKLWNSIVEEASRMEAALMDDDALDHATMQRFVSPITVQIEPEDYSDYFRTELLYREAVSQEPNNPLFLSNYAQYLYLVAQDHDRAEVYFKRSIQVKPVDAEALSRYANFLWLARKDLSAAEETFLEAIEADPSNTFHAGNYANFLWNSGGEDTCYPLGSPNDENCESL